MEDKKKTLLEELGLSHLSAEQKDQLNDQLTDVLQNRITVKILEVLTDEEKAELDRLGEAGDNEKMDAFLAEAVPGIDLITQEEYENLKREMIKRNDDLREALESKKTE